MGIEVSFIFNLDVTFTDQKSMTQCIYSKRLQLETFGSFFHQYAVPGLSYWEEQPTASLTNEKY